MLPPLPMLRGSRALDSVYSIRRIVSRAVFHSFPAVKTEKRPQVKVPHNLRFDAGRVKQELGLMEQRSPRA